MNPNLYSIWHLNLLYSSIETERRIEVINNCFWPLLDLAQKGYKIALEIPAHSLEITSELDPKWITELKKLIFENKIEIIGSGYTQLISPILPDYINSTNIEEGINVYFEILGITPSVWLINEQAFSDSLISLYSKYDNIKAVVIDWCALYSNNQNLDKNLIFNPQILNSSKGKKIPVIWSHSIAFQKFQYYVHDSIESDEFFQFYENIENKMKLSKCNAPSFCLYGNDAEVFDFRPGRFHTEANISLTSEWHKIEKIFEKLSSKFNYIFPSELVIENIPNNNIFVNLLNEPVTVKKQPKYNVTRWCLTGRLSPYINSALLAYSKNINSMSTSQKREICFLFSSDFRTHITTDRWNTFLARINEIDSLPPFPHLIALNQLKPTTISSISNSISYLCLNPRKGGTIEEFGLSNLPHLLGRVKHGYFDRMDMCSDWFSSNVVFQEFGKPQITDLGKTIIQKQDTKLNTLFIKSNFLSGSILKEFTLENNCMYLGYYFNVPNIPIGALRFSYITFNPEEICASSFKIESHSGGGDITTYELPDFDFSHGDNPTSLVSANNVFPMTQNICYIYTKSYKLTVEIIDGNTFPIPMIKQKIDKNGRLIRLFFSLSEVDETRKTDWKLTNIFIKFKMTITPRNL